jgi:hypothetical protein
VTLAVRPGAAVVGTASVDRRSDGRLSSRHARGRPRVAGARPARRHAFLQTALGVTQPLVTTGVGRDLGAIDRDHATEARPASAHSASTRRTGPPRRPRGARRTARPWGDPAAGARRSPGTRRPPRMRDRSPARTASHAPSTTTTARPSSPAHRRPGHGHPPDSRHRTRPDPSFDGVGHEPTRGDPQAGTP